MKRPRELKIKNIPLPSGADHPAPPNEALPKHEFSMGFIAQKGAGKTTTLMNILHFYKEYFHTIVIFSPTIDNDEKWEWIKKQKLLGENKKLKEWVKELKERKTLDRIVHGANQETDELPDLKDDHDPIIPEGCYLTEYSETMLKDILDEQDKMILTLKNNGKTKHLANRLLLVFDDLVGSDLFNNKRAGVFKILNVRHRHFSASVLMVTQAYKEIPPTIRKNFSCMIVFDIPNDQEVRCIYEENSMKLKFPEWLQVYEYAVKGDHDFMFINSQKPKGQKIMKNFSEYIDYKRSDDDSDSDSGLIEPNPKKIKK